MTDAIFAEWSRHESRFGTRWRVQMASDQRVVAISDERDDDLRDELDVHARTTRQRRIMLKDAHLIEGALATERTVTSLDDEARVAFAQTTSQVPKLAKIVWVNPAPHDNDAIKCLPGGAKPA